MKLLRSFLYIPHLQVTNNLKKYVVFRLILYFVLNIFLYVPLSNKVRLPLCSVAFSHSNDI